MQLIAIHEELLVLTSSLLDGELAWDDDDARVAWEVSPRPRIQHYNSAMWPKALMRGSRSPASLQPVLAGETTVDDNTVQLPRPGLSLLLCDRAELAVQYPEEATLPRITLHCAGLEREDQARLTREFEAVQERIESDGAHSLPFESSFMRIRSHLLI